MPTTTNEDNLHQFLPPNASASNQKRISIGVDEVTHARLGKLGTKLNLSRRLVVRGLLNFYEDDVK